MKFACPNCGQHIDAEFDWVGMKSACPTCGTTIVVPTPKEAEASLNPPPPPSPVVIDTVSPTRMESESNYDASDYRYWAFISYSSKDKSWGSWLHRAIETYGIPAEYVEHHQTPTGQLAPKRFHPVFRDRDELPASSDLGAVIKKALVASRYLIVICSPNAAQSEWVNKEIETFLGLGRRDHIFAVIVDGEPNAGDVRECFPPVLRQFEPIAADARPAGDGKTNAKLKLLAGMLGVNFDSLKQRDAKRRRRRLILTSVAVGLLVALMIALIGFAVRQHRSATEEKGKGARHRYGEDMLKLQNAWEQGDMPGFTALLDAQSQYHPGAVDRRGWEWYYWLKQTHGEFRTFKGKDELASICFTPDGQRLVTASADWTIRVWDVISGKEVLTFSLKGRLNKGLSVISISPDGQRLVTVGSTAKIWDAKSGNELLTLKADTSGIESVCFSPDGQRLVAAGSTMKVWDVRSGKETLTIKNSSKDDEEDLGEIDTVCFSPDGQRLVTGGDDKTLKIWNANTGKKLRTIKVEGLLTGFYNICFSPDGQRLAAGNENWMVNVWDANSGKNLFTLKGHKGPVRSVCFSPDSHRLVTGSADKTLKVWDVNTGKELFSSKGHLDEVTHVCFSPDGTILASCDATGIVKLWHGTISTEPLPLTVGAGPVFISANGERLASADAGVVKVWDAESGKQLRSIKVTGNMSPLSRIYFSPDGSRLAVGDAEDTIESSREPGWIHDLAHPVQVWDTATGKELAVITTKDDTHNCICFSSDGKRIALGYRVWDVESGKELISYNRTGDPIGCFSPDGKRFARRRSICDAASGKELVDIEWSGTPFDHMCFSPDGRRLASGGEAWDAKNGKRLFTFNGDTPCFSPDGKRIAATTPMGVKLYDAEDGQELLTIKGLKSAVSSVCFSADGIRLLVGHVDGKLETWEEAVDSDAD